jgi:hypothetical protein
MKPSSIRRNFPKDLLHEDLTLLNVDADSNELPSANATTGGASVCNACVLEAACPWWHLCRRPVCEEHGGEARCHGSNRLAEFRYGNGRLMKCAPDWKFGIESAIPKFLGAP